MPKMKTNRAAAKRFKVTATGKIKFPRQNKQHNPTKKSPKRIRQLRKKGLVGPADIERVRKLLPYS